MIDTKELRRLAQAATPGPWKACRNHECYEGTWFEIDPEDEAEYAAKPFTHIKARTGVVTAAHDLFVFDREDAEFIAAANPATITELLDRLEAAEKERDALREGLKRMCMDEDAEAKEAKVLQAKIAEMEKQEPVKHEFQGRDGTWHSFLDQRHYENTVADGRWPVRALYALPGAQPAQSVPDGYKLVPIELTPEMVEACYKNWQYGDKSARDIWRDMLAAAPEDK